MKKYQSTDIPGNINEGKERVKQQSSFVTDGRETQLKTGNI
jgi:hypothetical protein